MQNMTHNQAYEKISAVVHPQKGLRQWLTNGMKCQRIISPKMLGFAKFLRQEDQK